MKTSVVALLALSACAVATENHWKPTSTEECDDDDLPTPTFALPFPTWGGANGGGVEWTTSTIFSTTTHTITSCGPEVESCPAHSTVETTVIVPVSTTVCPVTAATVAPPAPPMATPPASSWVPPPPPPASASTWRAPPASASPSFVAVSAPPPTAAPPPPAAAAPTSFKPTWVGSVSAPVPSKPAPQPTFVTAGANQNVQRAGGALAIVLAAAALL